MDLVSHADFEELQRAAQACEQCPAMCTRKKVLSWGNGTPTAKIMFVAEAPGRHGAEVTMIPLHGDKSGDNFELLLETAGISRSEVFVTNAVLCNPQDEAGNNRPPKKEEIANCAFWLARQIAIVNPDIVVSLGATALKALSLVSPHDLILSASVRTKNEWNGRLIVPLYHPGQRAMLHRSMANQTADYYFVAELAKRVRTNNRSQRSNSRPLSDEGKRAVQLIVNELGEVSLFRLHKLLYLLDYYHFRAFGSKLTRFHYIRQKDGPYCVDIAGQFRKEIEGVSVVKSREGVIFRATGNDLLTEPTVKGTLPFLETVIDKYGKLSASELKTSVYLTAPMKALLKRERAGSSMLNAPLLAA